MVDSHAGVRPPTDARAQKKLPYHEIKFVDKLTPVTRPTPTGGAADEARLAQAIDRARRFLLRTPQPADDLPLWHDKDLYQPGAIVRAAVLAATQLSDPRAQQAAMMAATA